MNRYFLFNLQLFAGEKTEQATPRKREQARQKGQIFKSMDLSSAVILLAAFAGLNMMFPTMLGAMSEFTQKYYGMIGQNTPLTVSVVNAIALDSVLLIVRVGLPVVGVAALAAFLVNLAQVGFIFSEEALSFNLERLDPIEGLKRIFSKRAIAELVKSILKVSLIGYIVYSVAMAHINDFPGFMDMDLIAILQVLLAIVFEMAMKVGLALVILGIFDYGFQWWQYEESLKMSKQEVKDEYKNIEGDPKIKAKIKQRQREIAMRRMMAEVPKADVVITNPTHFAIALRYDAETMDAPKIIAKGQDFVALRIREIAQEAGVTVVENPELARGLYYVVEIGDFVPEEMFKAVAEVLAFVFRQKKKVL
ncbi:MAG: flagellar biosynthesis protein FlhB [Solirubrobacterales bacterium]